MDEQLNTILVVEDDATNRKLVRIILGKRYRIHEAESIAQALAYLKDNRPSLMLLDIRLGDGSSLDMIRDIRTNPAFDSVPAVALTAQAMKNDEARFLAAGFDGYVSKPIDTRHLPEVVEHFLREGRKSHA